ncbi:LysE family translocator [Bordetella bronchiseptica]
MTLATLALFVLASGLIIVTPGPTVLLALSNGSRHGVRRACWGMAGAVLADLVLVAAVAGGLGMLLAASEPAFQALKWIGAGALFSRSFLVALTNPKALLFMSAFLPQFIDPAAALAPQYGALALVLAVLNLAAMLGYAALGARLVRVLRTGGLRWINRLCGGMLVVLAGTVALYRRAG